jgi:hypothetical protein
MQCLRVTYQTLLKSEVTKISSRRRRRKRKKAPILKHLVANLKIKKTMNLEDLGKFQNLSKKQRSSKKSELNDCRY